MLALANRWRLRPQIRTAQIVSLVSLVALVVFADPSIGQPAVPRATTISGLLFHAGFFHGQRVGVRGLLRSEVTGAWLDGADDAVRVVGEVESTGTADPDGTIELRATFWDLGRLEPDDPRLAGYDLSDALADLRDRDWPQPGEILVLANASAVPFSRPAQPTLRSLALEPGRNDDGPVTIIGRYRGRNLYGDLPQAPRQSRWDFVLQSGDSAVWVTGKQPKGKGFELGLTARVDTGRWLEVSGVVRHGQGLVWLEATDLQAADTPLARPAPAPAEPAQRIAGPPPEVIFSAPVQDDVDHGADDPVRIQFSADMEADSFSGRVRARYVGEPTMLDIELTYRPGNRVLSVRLLEPLEPFRLVQVDLLDGVRSVESLALAPWTLTFSVSQ